MAFCQPKSILLLFLLFCFSAASPRPSLNPEWKRLSFEIQEKVCSGKSTEAQLNDLTKCVEELKEETKNKEQLQEDVEECLREAETDIGFSVDDANKESVYMICSGKFRMCMHQKLKARKQEEKENNNNNKEEGGENKEHNHSENKPAEQQQGGEPDEMSKDMERLQKMMECKRAAPFIDVVVVY